MDRRRYAPTHALTYSRNKQPGPPFSTRGLSKASMEDAAMTRAALHQRLSNEFMRRRNDAPVVAVRVEHSRHIKPDRKKRARALAADALDQTPGTPKTQSRRNEELLDGPKEFREERVDQH